MKNGSQRRTAIRLAFFVTLLWATSWVLVKVGLQGLPPLTFAALRLTLDIPKVKDL
jgi:drug/metabolite transporter (DMT)-like permease